MIYLDAMTPWTLCHALRLRRQVCVPQRAATPVYYFSASRAGQCVASLCERLGWLRARRLEFAYPEVEHGAGGSIWFLIEMQEIPALCRAVRSDVFDHHPLLQRWSRPFDRHRLLFFLEKSLAHELTPLVQKISVVAWYRRLRDGGARSDAVFLASRTPFDHWLRCYAAERGVAWRSLGLPHLHVVPLMDRLRHLVKDNMPRMQATAPQRSAGSPTRKAPLASARPPSGPVVAVPYHGTPLSLDLRVNTDLCWLPFAHLDPSQVLVYAYGPPLPSAMHDELQRAGIRAVALRRSARTGGMPLWRDGASIARRCLMVLRSAWTALRTSGALPRTAMDRWLHWRLMCFRATYDYWRQFFTAHGVRLHVDHSDWAKDRIPADEAIKAVGGVSVSFQRSAEFAPSWVWSRAVDVFFAFSSDEQQVQRERQSGSVIPQVICAGYLHDHAFSRVREPAQRLRRQLRDRGATFVVCFFDGHSNDDGRWAPSHEHRAEDYRFLCGQVLADPTLGVILKPKKPGTLRQRLAAASPDILSLLDAAVATGRCVLLDEGTALATTALPAEAGAASDVAIALFMGPTPALETALIGTPSLLLDREQLSPHALHVLERGRVVFTHWPQLWQAVQTYRDHPERLPGFGDWSAWLATCDTFRDGRAAERIGAHVGQLMQTLGRGASREQALAHAAEHYAARWGQDKVTCLT